MALIGVTLAFGQAEPEIRTAIGITSAGGRIEAWITEADLDYETPKTRVLLVGDAESADTLKAAWDWFRASPFAQAYALSVVPEAMLDASFPPQGDQYHSEDPEAGYLWRWIGMHAPDLVVEVRAGAGFSCSSGQFFVRRMGCDQADESAELHYQLERVKAAGVGTIPALKVTTDNSEFLKKLLDTVGFFNQSPAADEIRARLKRTPIEVANQLAAVYGHQLDTVAYIPAVAMIGRLRLGRLTSDDSHLAEVERIVRPYLEGKATFPERASGSNTSGHLIFSELAKATGNARYVELARTAADLGFESSGLLKESMPYHNEMSDAVFMGCAILAQVGGLTGEKRYFDMALRHLRFMQKLCLREDGIYRHSPLDEAAWGRGNGFPALGLALTLSETPESHPGRGEMLEAFRAHMAALVKLQDPTGMWHQVVDYVESYRELTSTSMIGFALERGLRRGWIEGEEFRRAADRAWFGVKTRVAADGSLVDVCRSTGKQKSLEDYFKRTAILGKDDRGGAMALLFATEVAEAARAAE